MGDELAPVGPDREILIPKSLGKDLETPQYSKKKNVEKNIRKGIGGFPAFLVQPAQMLITSLQNAAAGVHPQSHGFSD